MTSLSLDTLNALPPDEVARQLSGNPHERATFVRAAADAGVLEAQAVYGQMLLDGAGVECEPVEALRWFSRAAGGGHLLAINMVGRCYELGWGVAIDKARAAEWYRAAALRGLDWGMYNYATLLTLGQGVAEDKVEALDWFRRAAALGNAKSWNYIGSFHEDGWVVETNMTEAARCYAIAAKGGDFRGQFNHARMEARRKRYASALVWLERCAATANMRFARQVLAWLPSAESELGVAARWFEVIR